MVRFDHEKLNVYQAAVNFVAWVDGVLDYLPKSVAVCNQLDRASTSVPLNIAEETGNTLLLTVAGFSVLLEVLRLSVPRAWASLLRRRELKPRLLANAKLRSSQSF